MPPTLQSLQERARALQAEIDAELERRRAELGLTVKRGRVYFNDELRSRHRDARVSLGTFLAATRPLVVLTAPVIYGLIVPMIILDIAVSMYQFICFPVYGIAKVRRRDHIFIDRQHLAYLNALQKLNCVYCGYGNGVFSFAREIAVRTEAYWCPIKHAGRVRRTHMLYDDFLEYGDEKDLNDRWNAERERLKELE